MDCSDLSSVALCINYMECGRNQNDAIWYVHFLLLILLSSMCNDFEVPLSPSNFATAYIWDGLTNWHPSISITIMGCDVKPLSLNGRGTETSFFVTCHHESLGLGWSARLGQYFQPANPLFGARLCACPVATQTTKPTASLVQRLQKCSCCLLYWSARQWACRKR